MSKFTRFNAPRYFNIDGFVFRTKVDETSGEVKTVYMTPADLYEEKPEIPCKVVGIYKKNFPQKTLEENPGLPAYRYTIAIKISAPDEEDEYVYVNTPFTMNDSFDTIMADQYLIKEVQRGNCAIYAYKFTKEFKDRTEDRYGLKFQD